MAYTTINKSTDHFNTKLYTGNGSTQSITGVGFQPDWIWQKARNQTYDHRLFDAVRGTTKSIYSNTTGAEETESGVTSFDSDGFSLGSNAGSNGNTVTYASWNWKANGSGSANTDGSISSTVSANTTSGFSIVKYVGNGSVGATVGHGLSATPKIVFFKDLDATRGWNVIAPTILGNGYYLVLNSNASSASYNSSWTTNSTQIVLADGGGHNASGNNYIAYCFAEKQGFSKFGSYVGNGSTDGSFIYTGFKPAMVIIKQSSASGENWNIYDNKRGGDGAIRKVLYADTNDDEENKTGGMDFLANGIKMRGTDGAFNTSATYIYMAFAEAPLVGSNNVPCTAR